jgi:hypothetical protein
MYVLTHSHRSGYSDWEDMMILNHRYWRRVHLPSLQVMWKQGLIEPSTCQQRSLLCMIGSYLNYLSSSRIGCTCYTAHQLHIEHTHLHTQVPHSQDLLLCSHRVLSMSSHYPLVCIYSSIHFSWKHVNMHCVCLVMDTPYIHYIPT